jgi:hypothetical protein
MTGAVERKRPLPTQLIDYTRYFFKKRHAPVVIPVVISHEWRLVRSHLNRTAQCTSLFEPARSPGGGPTELVTNERRDEFLLEGRRFGSAGNELATPLANALSRRKQGFDSPRARQ